MDTAPASSREPTNGRYLQVLLGIVLAAWLLRIVMTAGLIGLTNPPDPRDGLDQLDYDLLAYRLVQGEGYTLADGTPTARRAPGTSLWLAPIYALFGHSYLAAHLWITGLSAAICAAGAALMRPIGGARLAWLVAAGLALHPGLTYYAMFLWSEAPFTLCATWGTWWTVRSLRLPTRTCWALGAGLLWGMAILLRPQAILIAPCAGLLWCLMREGRTALLRPLAVQGLVAAAVVAPWVIRNAVVMGKPCLGTVLAAHTFWGAHNTRTFTDPRVRGDWIGLAPLLVDGRTLPRDELAQEAAAWRYAWEDLRAHSAELPRLLVAKVWRLLSPEEHSPNASLNWAFGLAWCLTLPGLIFGWSELRRRDPLLAGVIAAQLLSTVLCVLIFYGNSRFRHVHEPLFLVISVLGWQGLAVVCSRWLFRSETLTTLASFPEANGCSQARG